MEKLVIFGTGEGSKLIYKELKQNSEYEVVAFTIDRNYIKEETYCGLQVVPFEDITQNFPPEKYKMFVGIFANRMNMLRAEKYLQAKEKGYSLINYIHPKTIVGTDVTLGDNCFVFEGTILRSGLTIGNDVIVMAGAFLGHDTVIQDHCFIASRAAILGAVTIESYCVVGPNATIMEDLIIRQECLIGGGSFIQKNTNPKEVYKAAASVLLPLTSDKLSGLIYRTRR